MPARRGPRPSRRGALVAAIAVSALAVALLATALAPAAGRDHRRAQRRGGVVRVNISDFAFHPRALKVRRGTRIVFVNRDSVPHTATRRGSFNTGRIRPRRGARVKLRRRGVYRYVCTIHPFMRGKIVVR